MNLSKLDALLTHLSKKLPDPDDQPLKCEEIRR